MSRRLSRRPRHSTVATITKFVPHSDGSSIVTGIDDSNREYSFHVHWFRGESFPDLIGRKVLVAGELLSPRGYIDLIYEVRLLRDDEVPSLG